MRRSGGASVRRSVGRRCFFRGRMTRSLLGFALGVVCVFAGKALAQPEVAVPPELAPYRDWVLKDAPDRACPLRGDSPMCEWTGRLVLNLDANGGTFGQRVVMDHDALIALPGAPGRWPFEVTASRVDIKS